MAAVKSHWHAAPARTPRRRLGPPRQECPKAAADSQADQEHGQDQRERVHGSAKDQREQTRPHHPARSRRHSGESDRHIHDPVAGRSPRALLDREVGRHFVPGRSGRQRQGDRGHGHIQGNGEIGGRRHVVNAQLVEAGQKAAKHRTGDVAAVEEAQPRYPKRTSLHLQAQGIAGSVGAHQQCGRQQAHPGHRACAQQDAPRGHDRHNACPIPVRPTACRTTPRARRRRSPVRAEHRPGAGADGSKRGAAIADCPGHVRSMNVPQ